MLNSEELIDDYLSGNGVEFLCRKYHLGKLKVKDILRKNGVPIKARGGQSKDEIFLIPHWSVLKYKEEPGKHYIASSKDGNLTTPDYMNKSGVLTSYIKEKYGKMSTLYERRKYYMKTGNYWWEQWFNIILVDDVVTKKCPYCDWETIDIHNRSGAFVSHILKCHGISKTEHLKNHPEDRKFLSLANKSLDREMEEDESRYVMCAVCGKKLSRLDSRHLKKHGLTKLDYLIEYGGNTYSNEYYQNLLKLSNHMNLSLDGRNLFTSKPEREILEYVRKLGFTAKKNRTILNGQELDIYIPEKKIAIEFNGCKYHTEEFGGKSRDYHLNKLSICNDNGIKLIQIFEDEYFYHKECVLSKIRHILGCNEALPSAFARKCSIKEISLPTAEFFMNKFHIQGSVTSSVYLGAFFEETLVGVMQFKKDGRESGFWELTRYATNSEYRCPGVASKLFSFFVKKYKPKEIKSFADRRWTTSKENNLYTKLGFIFSKTIPPSYTYYNSSIDRYRRIHRFSLRKKKLQKFLPDNCNDITEKEMAKALGYDRIWDCGLFKYVWKSPDITQENHPV